MRTTTMGSILEVSLAMGLLLSGPGSTAHGADASPRDVDSSLHQLQDRLDEQTRRVDRLYRLLGPHLEEMEQEAARVEKRQREDERLALQSVRQVTDDTLTGIGCMNPVQAEFAAITRDGGLRLFNEQGQAGGDLRSVPMATRTQGPRGSHLRRNWCEAL